MLIVSSSAHASCIYLIILFKTVLIVSAEFLCSQSLMLELTSHLCGLFLQTKDSFHVVTYHFKTPDVMFPHFAFAWAFVWSQPIVHKDNIIF
jgi:hypothetical protein